MASAPLNDFSTGFRLIACRELMDTHPESLRIREQVEALEEALPNRPGVAVSFCRTLIETTCKTILIDRGQAPDESWEAAKLLSETTKFLHLGIDDGGQPDPALRSGAEKLLRGVNSIVDGVVEIRNAHGAAAHGADAYAPMLDGRYAEILAYATDAVVGLLFRTHVKQTKGNPLSRLRYGDHADFDESVDGEFGPFVVLDTPLLASEALFRTDNQAYRAALVEYVANRDSHRMRIIQLLRSRP